jgi:hypothetical protein
MSKPTKSSIVETALQDVFEHPLRIIVAALLFAAGLALAGPSSYVVSALPPFLGIDNLIRQFAAGLMVLAGFLLAFIKGHFGIGVKAIFSEAKTLATGAVLWTIGMFFVGIGNANGFTPLGIVGSLVGYALLLVSLVISGTLAVSVSNSTS